MFLTPSLRPCWTTKRGAQSLRKMQNERHAAWERSGAKKNERHAARHAFRKTQNERHAAWERSAKMRNERHAAWERFFAQPYP